MIYCKVNEILENKSKTPLWLAQELNCSVEFVNELINNSNKAIDFRILEKLCEFLECTPNDLFKII